MKSLITLFLILGSLFANQAFAEDATPQPTTGADCEAASGWSWSETANVCEGGSKDVAALKAQPLTRSDCEQAGMAWNDNALVCDGAAVRKATADAANPIPSSILITIDKATQSMTVLIDGMRKYDWPVSTGKRGYFTPSGTYTATSMNEIWYSKEWDNAPMPHAIFFMKDGHAIHGSYEVKHLGKPASHGCVRIAPQNATILYDLVKKTGLENTQVVLIGETPGGESKASGKVASSAKPRARYAAPRSFDPANSYYAESFSQSQRRGGFFRRLFSRQ
ncbi:MAG: L,D-transpeptidase [Methyloceanibacter sp.]|nr:L,D-transpeptidase [Methyloceanibacter sp.]